MKASDRVMRDVLELIAQRRFAVGGELPSEAQLAEQFAVSRLTVREAMSTLAAAGVLEVRQGRRNRVAEVAAWSVLDPDVVAARSRLAGDSPAVVADLMEARRVLEVGIARLAAERITDAQLAELEEALDAMRRELDGDVETSAQADIRFHEVIVEAAGNAFLTGAFDPLQQMLLTVRMRTSSVRSVRVDAIAWHERILAALRVHDAEAAAQSMRGHMDQTVGATHGIRLERQESA